jgi:hypothetical protein
MVGERGGDDAQENRQNPDNIVKAGEIRAQRQFARGTRLNIVNPGAEKRAAKMWDRDSLGLDAERHVLAGDRIGQRIAAEQRALASVRSTTNPVILSEISPAERQQRLTG